MDQNCRQVQLLSAYFKPSIVISNDIPIDCRHCQRTLRNTIRSNNRLSAKILFCYAKIWFIFSWLHCRFAGYRNLLRFIVCLFSLNDYVNQYLPLGYICGQYVKEYLKKLKRVPIKKWWMRRDQKISSTVQNLQGWRWKYSSSNVWVLHSLASSESA